MTMDPATINESTFTLKQGNITISGTVSYSGITAQLCSSIIINASLYCIYRYYPQELKIPGSYRFHPDYIWTFTTAANAVPPIVFSTDPSNNAQNVVLNKVISVTFSVPMDPASVNQAFSLKQGATVISGSKSYSGNTFTFTPTVDLQPATTYTGTVTTAAKNTSGTAMTSTYVWQFTTGTVTAPEVSRPTLQATSRMLLFQECFGGI